MIEIKEENSAEGLKLYKGSWGYAIVRENKLWIPAIQGDMKEIINALVKKTGINKIVFSAVLNAEKFKKHLKNITKEWDEWFKEAEDYSHCIEIEWEG